MYLLKFWMQPLCFVTAEKCRWVLHFTLIQMGKNVGGAALSLSDRLFTFEHDQPQFC